MSEQSLLSQEDFQLKALTASILEQNYTPSRLGSMGIFEEGGITTTNVVVEISKNIVSLIDVASRGAAGQVSDDEDRKEIHLGVPHLPQNDSVLADAVQNIRQFGSDNKLEAIKGVIDARLLKMRRNMEYTLESHRVLAIQGKYFDTSGNQQSAFTTFDITEKTVPFALTDPATEITTKCVKVIDEVEEALGGLPYDYIHAMCGKTFFDNLKTHPAYKETFLASNEAEELRKRGRNVIEFDGIIFERYNGTTDVKIPASEARAFPVGVPDFLKTSFAPANYTETVNTIGLPLYAKMEEMPFNKGYTLEVQSNPLCYCTRPGALIKLKNAAS